MTMRLIAWAVLAAAMPLGAETILAVFAHPDDETTVGPVLAKYAAEGHTVKLLTLTSGQIGTANTKLKAGDELGAAREEELRCACRGLGIGEPELGRFMDGGINTGPVLEKIAQKVRQTFEQVKPDIVITWGPDGLTGHPDHRAASAVATQVFQRQGLLPHKPRKLYYVAYPESLFTNLKTDNKILIGLAGGISSRVVADAFITTVVDATKHLDKAEQAIRCHKTQWPPEQAQAMADLNSKVLAGKVYLRLALSHRPLPKSKSEKDILK